MKADWIVCDYCHDPIGRVTEAKAKRAIELNVAKEGLSKKLYTEFSKIKEFNSEYARKIKTNRYETKCWECGKKIRIVDITKRAFCDDCTRHYSETMGKIEEEYRKMRGKLNYERAIELLNRQQKSLDMRKYREPALTIKEYLKDNYTKFDSSYEIAAAIVLLKEKINLKIQPAIGKYQADFILKDDNIVLEIDGERHNYRQEYDFARDIKIRKELGQDWEIVRIPTKYLDKDIINLYEAVMAIKAYKTEVRSKNNGMLPEWYSERESKAFDNIALINKS